uniref:Uncharacterized protein n=1 Tax=viral metagenome TaxID=1070528 RepID=A0A6C0LU02_9ZZZZ
MSHKDKKNKKNKKNKKVKAASESNEEIVSENEDFVTNENLASSDEENNEESVKITDKQVRILKAKIIQWLNYDDTIKQMTVNMKKYKDSKKHQEDSIMNMIDKFGLGENKIDVEDNNDGLRGRVYKYKTTTKGPLKEEIIKNALMEAMRDEKQVNQLLKKIDSKRPLTERCYLKRTKGAKE